MVINASNLMPFFFNGKVTLLMFVNSHCLIVVVAVVVAGAVVSRHFFGVWLRRRRVRKIDVFQAN